LLKAGGVVVFDDFRAQHTPGVAAAVWRATNEDLKPFAVTMGKLYATFDDTQPWLDVLLAWLEERSFWRHEVQQVAGEPLLRIYRPPKRKQAAQKPAEHQAKQTSTPGPARKRWWRRSHG